MHRRPALHERRNPVILPSNMKEILANLDALIAHMEQAQALVRLPEKKAQVGVLDTQMQAPEFWNTPTTAQQVSQQYAELKKEVDLWEGLHTEAVQLREFASQLTGADVEAMSGEVESQLADLTKRFDAQEFLVLLSDKYDTNNAIMALHAGAGGTEAQDWVGMLLRMYTRFCEQQGWNVVIVDESRGQEAGWKSVTIHITGRYAYGYLKGEHGVHRLVRISPFDAEKMRHTSFALAEVTPELDDLREVEIKDEDLRIDTFMSGGKGGQSVNTTYSAVRIVHLPTGITVSCQNERSQQQNRETAMKILRGKLHRLMEEHLLAEKAELRGSYQSAAWGNQARSYVLQPYQLVKDHRTEHETADTDAVLNGDILPFIEHYLAWRKREQVKATT